jgi:hypothetical protein
MSENAICFLEHTGRTYTLYTINSDGQIKTGSQWRLPADYFLDCFAYGSDGAFYAVLKHYNKQSQTVQTFVQLKNDGAYQTIKLKNLNRIPKTKLNSSIKKKGKKADFSITDIHFNGTSLSVTYSNYAVKFYNIAECLPLGTGNITATPGQTAFYRSVFASTGLTDGYESILNFYDIRTGETLNSFSMDKLSMGEILLFANYRDDFYLLTKNGLYTGSLSKPDFNLITGISALGLPSGGRIHRLYAARDGKLYIVYQDSQAVYHLYDMETISK